MKLNLPTKITLLRLFLIPVFVAVFFIEAIPYRYAIAAGVFVLAAITDAIDGHIARSRNLVTNLGKFLDPIADKVLISTAMIVLLVMKEEICTPFGSAAQGIYVALAICVCIIMARELIISAFRQIAAATGFIMAADKLGKIKATVQDVSVVFLFVGGAFSAATFGFVCLVIGYVLFAAATVLTVWSGISYIVKNKAVLNDPINQK
ncbi:MAG: CDP-diacylglycerol--glycerol-3-phosphate 3-phosphatidyltransferase [Clostridia bacterium]|nr:CDP-diacylglycerol--glycerol-3-phosphate 3-phosphatidyltransferase [Clostridia bacterium]